MKLFLVDKLQTRNDLFSKLNFESDEESSLLHFIDSLFEADGRRWIRGERDQLSERFLSVKENTLCQLPEMTLLNEQVGSILEVSSFIEVMAFFVGKLESEELL